MPARLEQSWRGGSAWIARSRVLMRVALWLIALLSLYSGPVSPNSGDIHEPRAMERTPHGRRPASAARTLGLVLAASVVIFSGLGIVVWATQPTLVTIHGSAHAPGNCTGPNDCGSFGQSWVLPSGASVALRWQDVTNGVAYLWVMGLPADFYCGQNGSTVRPPAFGSEGACNFVSGGASYTFWARSPSDQFGQEVT